jgi:UDP-glucose 4-epimerase
MRVLVTGGAGFIGSYVTAELISQGHQVLRFDHLTHGPHDQDVIVGDIRDATTVTEAVAHADAVIHLAAVLGTQETIDNPRPAAETNILGSLNIFEAITQYKVPVVYAAVGNHWMRDHGTGAYTISKTCVEDFARMYRKFRGTEVSIVRPVNAYGARQSIAAPFGSSKVRKIIPAFACRALSGMPIEIYGSGQQISDMVHVSDVAKVMVAAIGADLGPYEVGPTTSHTVSQVAEIVAEEAVFITGQSASIEHLPMRRGEVEEATVSADPTTLEPLGISARDFVKLEDGLRDTVQWFWDMRGQLWDSPA